MAAVFTEIVIVILSVFCFFIGIDCVKYFDLGIGIVLILLGLVLLFTAIIPFV